MKRRGKETDYKFENLLAHVLKWIAMPPRLLVTNVVGYDEDENGGDERAGAAYRRVEHLAAGRGAGSSYEHLFWPRVALILETYFLSPEVEAGRVPPRQGDVYPKAEVDLGIVRPAMEGQGPRLQPTDRDFTGLGYVEGARQR